MLLQQIIGLHSCREALQVRPAQDLKKIYLRPGWEKSSALSSLVQIAKSKNLKPEIKSIKKLNGIAQSHQGVCLLAHYRLSFDISLTSPQSIVLVLDRIQDPRNLGAIIRNAWLMGVSCIFSSFHNSTSLSPLVIKAASGGIEHVPIEIENNLNQCIEKLKKNQFWIYALDSRSPQRFWEKKLNGKVAFLLGGESSGLKLSLKKACDDILSVPQTSKNSSYNVSVTTGIILAECLRQRSSGD